MPRKMVPDEQRRVWVNHMAQHPPHVRFSSDSRTAFAEIDQCLDHIEFMMSLLEAHPLIPFERYTFGSDLLDFRRGVAYEIVLRQLAHTRSLVANVNIGNRTGIGTALRCMLEMHAFSEYLLDEDRLGDAGFLEKLYHGRALTPGGWYDIEKQWQAQHQGPMPKDAKDFLKALLNLPRVGDITKAAHETDKGAGYLYSFYSEFIHPAFARPREDGELALGVQDIPVFGTDRYYQSLLAAAQPVSLLTRDIEAASFCLELFWPRLLDIDPFFAGDCRAAVLRKLAEQGMPIVDDREGESA